MKLWVDDIRNAPDDTWHVARTAIEAIRALARFDMEVVSLDHDISHQVGMGELTRPYPCGETFASVAYYLAQQIDFKVFIANTNQEGYTPPRIILHTSNEVAGDEMYQMFKDTVPGLEVEKKYMGAANRLEMEV
jgi:NAD+-processing family protein with receiver domain